MSFAVTPCPRCGRLKITQLPAKTTGCPWCGKKYAVGQTAQRAYETLDQARAALAALSEGGDKEALAVAPAKPQAKNLGRTPLERLVLAAEALTIEKGDFAEEELAERVKSEGAANWKSALKILIDHGCVYEVRAGRYKSL